MCNTPSVIRGRRRAEPCFETRAVARSSSERGGCAWRPLALSRPRAGTNRLPNDLDKSWFGGLLMRRLLVLLLIATPVSFASAQTPAADRPSDTKASQH